MLGRAGPSGMSRRKRDGLRCPWPGVLTARDDYNCTAYLKSALTLAAHSAAGALDYSFPLSTTVKLDFTRTEQFGSDRGTVQSNHEPLASRAKRFWVIRSVRLLTLNAAGRDNWDGLTLTAFRHLEAEKRQ